MASFNQVILVGNLGQDPDIKHMQNGNACANLSIATSESWKDKDSGERKERVQWHRVVVWAEGLVKVIEKHLAKGDQIMVTGQLETRKWQDQDGKDRYATEVVLRPFKSGLQIIRCKAWDKSGKRDDAADDAGETGTRSMAQAGGYSSGRAAGAKSNAPLDDKIPF